MDIWEILEIERTTDEGLIKKAYRIKLKSTRPDDDAVAFMELRKSYEAALEYAAEAGYDEDYWDDETDDTDETDDFEDLEDLEDTEELELTPILSTKLSILKSDLMIRLTLMLLAGMKLKIFRIL